MEVPQQEPEAVVEPIVLPMWRVQRVGGIALNLGTMPYDELMTVYENCGRHLEAAASDMALVATYLDYRFPGGPGPEEAA